MHEQPPEKPSVRTKGLRNLLFILIALAGIIYGLATL